MRVCQFRHYGNAVDQGLDAPQFHNCADSVFQSGPCLSMRRRLALHFGADDLKHERGYGGYDKAYRANGNG